MAFEMDYAMKQMIWESAKGKLRALVSIQGSYSSTDGVGEKYREIEKRVEAFITEIEDEGMHE